MTLLPEVESALLGAIRTQQRVPRRRLIGPAVTAALVSLTLVVAVGALVVLRHHRTEAAESGGNTRIAASRQELIDTLGVLRRPQAGPRLAAHALATLAARRGKLDSSLARTVNVAGLHGTLALLPLTTASGAGGRVTERLAVTFLGLPGAQGPTTQAVDVNVLRKHGISTVFAPAATDHVLVVVPDGVLRVRIDHVAVSGRRHLELRPPRHPTMTATVHDNVAGFAVGPLVSKTPGTSRVEGVPALVQTSWLGPGGRVIARPTVRLGVYVLFGAVTRRHADTHKNSAFCRQNPRVC